MKFARTYFARTHYARTPVSTAATVCLLLAGAAYAQTAKPAEEATTTITVTGIRASLESALNIKRNATANVDAITAVDVGKMPDKNLADSLQRVVGVSVRTDYDEAEKVSMRGTNADMSLILFNGHTVSGGDWYVSDQLSSSRSTSLSLMPSSVLNSATVYKTSQANIVDGGLAGTINVTTRKPLDEPKTLGGVISLGGVYADLPGKTSPQLNASFNWRTEDKLFGVIGQVFAEKRYIRRDSVSRFAYAGGSGWDVINTATMLGITDASLAGTGYKAADLNGVRLPGSMSSEFVEGVRDRKGGMLALQARPMQGLDVGLTGFYSEMKADNYGRLNAGAMFNMLNGSGNTTGTGAPFTSSNGQRVYAQIKNPVITTETTIYGDQLRILKSADILFPTGTTPQYIGNSEASLRSGAKATSGFLDLDATYKASNDLTLKGLVSSTRGEGSTNLDQTVTYARYGTGTSYNLNGPTGVPDVKYYGVNTNAPVLNADGSGYALIGRGIGSYKTIDRENSVALDGNYKLDKGIFTTLDGGVRFADHRRNLWRSAPSFGSTVVAAPAANLAASYPGNFGTGLGSMSADYTSFYFPREVLDPFLQSQYKATTPEFERRVAGEIDMRERQTAGYVMQSLEGANGGWSGNVGLRFVRTEVNALIATPVAATICPKIKPGDAVVPCAAFPGVINTSGDGSSYASGAAWNPASGTSYYKVPSDRSFNNVLPSLNLRMDLAPQVVGRFGASETIGRQNYNVYGLGYTGQACTTAGCTVNGPNPTLKPMTSTNFDLSVAWYFARRSMVSLSVFDSKIKGYAKTGAIKQDVSVDLVDPVDNTTKTYFINTSSQQGAKIKGVELAYEQPLVYGFGVQANASRAETHVDDGRPMIGASKNAANLGVYFENDSFSARLVYNYRSEYINTSTAPSPTANSQGLSVINGVTMPVAPTIAGPVSNLAFSANYEIVKGLQLSFSATNLLNPVRATYRYSEEEQQKLDSSGRQYYFEARYKF